MKIIEVGIKERFEGYTSEKHEYVMNIFKMPIPNKVRLHFCDITINKMKEAIALTNSHKFNEIKFISTTHQDSEHCFVELFKDEHLVEVSQYEDFDRYFNTFDAHFFNISCSSFYKDCFQANFLFTSASCEEFSFNSKNFKI